MALQYRVVTTNVPNGAKWKSIEVSRHFTFREAVKSARATIAEDKPVEIQSRLFSSEPWQWIKRSEWETSNS